MKNKRLYLVRDSYGYRLHKSIPTLSWNSNSSKWYPGNRLAINWPSYFCVKGINHWARSLRMKVGEYRTIELSRTKPTKNIPYWILQTNSARSYSEVFTRNGWNVSGFISYFLKQYALEPTLYAYEV